MVATTGTTTATATGEGLPPATRTAFRTCPLCEAGCGLEIGLAGTDGDARVTRIRGDRDDVFSHGFICPKGSTLKQLHEDPDWLRRPLVKRDGALRRGRLGRGVRRGRPPARRGRRRARPRRRRPCTSATRTPTRSAGLLYLRPLLKALGTTNVFSASTVDQRPKEVGVRPDVRRRAHRPGARRRPHRLPAHARRQPVRVERQPRHRARLARPPRGAASRGAARSSWSTPAAPRTAEEADEHVAIRPGADAFLLMALVNVLDADGLVDTGRGGRVPVAGVDEVAARPPPVHPRGRGRRRPGSTPTSSARWPATSPPPDRRASTAASAPPPPSSARSRRWLVDVLNVAHRQPRPARRRHVHQGRGRRRPTPGARPGSAGACELHRRHSRVRGAARDAGRAAGRRAWPRRSTRPARARSGRWSPWPATRCCRPPTRAGSTPPSPTLDFYVAVDPYVNETTRHADVILPPPTALQKGHYDLALLQLALRNVANYSPAGAAARRRPARRVGDPGPPGARSPRAWAPTPTRRWSTTSSSATLVGGGRRRRDRPDRRAATPTRSSALLGDRTRPRAPASTSCCAPGPTATGSAPTPSGLSLDVLLANPHGIDLGPLEPRLPDVLRTPSGMVELAPEPILDDVARLREAARRRPTDGHGARSAGATCGRTTRGCTTSRCW